MPDWHALGGELLDAEPLLLRMASADRGPLASRTGHAVVTAIRETLTTGFVRDLHSGLRLLVKNRGFSAAIILTLAICLGANAAVFTVVHAVLLRPLPVPEPDRIVGIGDVYPTITPHDILSNDVPSYFDRLDAEFASARISLGPTIAGARVVSRRQFCLEGHTIVQLELRPDDHFEIELESGQPRAGKRPTAPLIELRYRIITATSGFRISTSCWDTVTKVGDGCVRSANAIAPPWLQNTCSTSFTRTVTTRLPAAPERTDGSCATAIGQMLGEIGSRATPAIAAAHDAGFFDGSTSRYRQGACPNGCFL